MSGFLGFFVGLLQAISSLVGLGYSNSNSSVTTQNSNATDIQQQVLPSSPSPETSQNGMAQGVSQTNTQTTAGQVSDNSAPSPTSVTENYSGWTKYSDSEGRFTIEIPTNVPVLVPPGKTINRQSISPSTPYVITIIPLDANNRNDLGTTISLSPLTLAPDLEYLTVNGMQWSLGTETSMNEPVGESVAVAAVSDLRNGYKLNLSIEGPKNTDTYKTILKQLIASVHFN